MVMVLAPSKARARVVPVRESDGDGLDVDLDAAPVVEDGPTDEPADGRIVSQDDAQDEVTEAPADGPPGTDEEQVEA
jgi:hypothetical protein